MADCKTNLRELSFCLGLRHCYENENENEISPQRVLEFCVDNIVDFPDLEICGITAQGGAFDLEEREIFKNGYELGVYARGLDCFSGAQEIIEWVARNNQSGSAIDVIVDGKGVSLKENSKILTNMGLSSMVNAICGAKVLPRGTHIFEYFAGEEFEDWFQTTKRLVVEYLKGSAWTSIRNPENKMSVDGDSLFLKCSQGTRLLGGIEEVSYQQYDEFLTNPYKKVFAKFVREELGASSVYRDAKRKCELLSGKRLLEWIGHIEKRSGLNPDMQAFFRLEPEGYYFGKAGSGGPRIFYVPSLDEFCDTFVMENLQCVVADEGKSQLNIHITIRNVEEERLFVLENQLRYSHGMFVGTPEAKQYLPEGEFQVIYSEVSSPG